MDPDPAPATRDFGAQPLDRLMLELGLGNHDLVLASPSQLTHKQVQKARKGRRLTPNLQHKVKEALEAALAKRAAGDSSGETPQPLAYQLGDLFSYATPTRRSRTANGDPHQALSTKH